MLSIDITNNSGTLIYNDIQNDFNIHPNFIKDLLNYEGKLKNYNERIAVDFSQTYIFKANDISQNLIQNYLEKVSNELLEFVKISWTQNRTTYHVFQKSKEITGNLTVKNSIRLCFKKKELMNMNIDQNINLNIHQHRALLHTLCSLKLSTCLSVLVLIIIFTVLLATVVLVFLVEFVPKKTFNSL